MQNYFPWEADLSGSPCLLFYSLPQKTNLKCDLINNASIQGAKHLQGSVTPWCPKSPGKKEIMCHFPCTSRELFIAQHANENPTDPGKLMCLPKGIVQDQIQDAHVCSQTHSLSSQLPLIQYEGAPCTIFILVFALSPWVTGNSAGSWSSENILREIPDQMLWVITVQKEKKNEKEKSQNSSP